MKTIYHKRNIAIWVLSLAPFCWIASEIPEQNFWQGYLLGLVWGLALWMFFQPVDFE